MPRDGSAEGPPDRSSSGRLQRGVYAKDVILDDHPPARRQRRRRLRLRIRRRHVRPHVDGRADDGLQHVDRGGRARRLRQSGSDDLRLHPRPAVRAAGRRLRSRVRAGGASMASDADASLRRRGRDRRGVDPADGDVGHQPGPVGRDRRADSCRAPTRKRSRSWDFRRGSADEGHADRRRVRRLVHERPALGSAGGGARRCAGITSRRT